MTASSGAAEVARQLTVDVGVRRDTVAMNVQLLVVHQSTLLSEYHRRDVGKIDQRMDKFQLGHLQHHHTSTTRSCDDDDDENCQ